MQDGRQRLDKWLFFARFSKSRTLAAKLVADGYVRVNGARIDTPARPVGPGDVLTIAALRATCVVEILAIGSRRGPAPEAQGLYAEVSRDPAALVSPAASR